MTYRRWLLALFMSVSACSEEDSSKELDPTGEGSLYLVGTFVLAGGDDGQTYLHVTNSFDEKTKIDETAGLELQGEAAAFAFGGAVYVSQAAAPTVTRYTVGSKLNLVKEETIDFSGLGFTEGPKKLYFVSTDKAYLFDASGLRVIVWNPSKMELADKTIDLKEIDVEGFVPELWTDSYTLEARDGHLYVPVTWSNAEKELTRQGTGVLIVDTDKDSVIDVLHDERCDAGGASVRLVQDKKDNIYFFPAASEAIQLDLLADEPRPTCALRINQGEDVFDPDYKLELKALTDGLSAQGAIPDGKSGIYFTAADPERWEARESNFDDFWGLWHHDLETGETNKVDSFPWWTGAMYYYDLGTGGVIVPFFNGSFDDPSSWTTAYYRMGDDAEPSKVFTVNSSWSALGRIR